MWQVGLLAVQGRFVVSVLRRVGKTFLYPNEVVERHFGVPATTRSWKTVLKICSALEEDAGRPAQPKKRVPSKRSPGSKAVTRPGRPRGTSRGR
jgi:hypothetical protein